MSETEDMVERVARALHAERMRVWQENEPASHPEMFTWEEDNEPFREQLRQEARACIEAMREPTEAMKLAGERMDHLLGRPVVAVSYAEAWQALIDSALQKDTRG